MKSQTMGYLDEIAPKPKKNPKKPAKPSPELMRTLKVIEKMPVKPLRKHGWDLIDTAPKDGTRILVFREGEQYVAQWLQSWQYWGVSVRRPKEFADGDWEPFHDIGGSRHAETYSLPSPTHWMPLPAPPESSHKNGGE